MNILELEKWFQRRCDGDWEHQGGLSVETTDNPGWYIKIEFSNAKQLFDLTVSGKSICRSETDFVTFKYDESAKSLGIACGLFNLSEALQLFLLLEGGN